MHFWIALIFSIWLTKSTFAQPLNEVRLKNLASYGKVWGFLKYYHPEVAKGKFDWDAVLVKNYLSVKTAKSKAEFNVIISRILDSVGYIAPNRSKALSFPDSLKKNLNISWIFDTSALSLYNSMRLHYIYQNRQPSSNYYISRTPRVGNPRFSNENPYSDLILPNESYRILALFRYWNVINYYYPYFFQLDKNWDNVLLEQIPRFINVSSDYEYFRKIQELSAQINDGHGMVYSSRYNYFAKMRIIPIKVNTFNDKAYITGFLNDSICKTARIQKGDVIKKIDNFETSLLRAHIARYMPASNNTYLNYKIDQWLPLVKKDTILLEVQRNDSIFQIKIPALNNTKKLTQRPDKKYVQIKWTLLSDSVGYINMGVLNQMDVIPAYKKIRNTKYLIIDSRNYPHWLVYPLSRKLLKTRKPFIQITEPDYDYPGIVKYIPPLKAGKVLNPEYYQGKIIILVNSETMSRAEFTAMAIKQAENVIIIGTQTAAADGDVSILPLPGAMYSYFSGLGVYHPDGKITQRIGIKPDIEVTPTLEGVLNERDEYIDRAMEYILSGK